MVVDRRRGVVSIPPPISQRLLTTQTPYKDGWSGAIPINVANNGDGFREGLNRAHTTGLTPGSAVTRSRNLAPRISKLRYWSNEAQAGDSSTTGSASPEASASRAA